MHHAQWHANIDCYHYAWIVMVACVDISFIPNHRHRTHRLNRVLASREQELLKIKGVCA